MKILWLSQHKPTELQMIDLSLDKAYGCDAGDNTEIIHDTRVFGDAGELVQRFKASGASDLVVVAPLSVLEELCKHGLRPLWAEMEPCSQEKAEVTIHGRYGRPTRYRRHRRFRRVVRVAKEFSDQVVIGDCWSHKIEQS